ncbi:MAG: hypothetical protein ACI9LM_003108 [Alteromonadaceae bacterium]|jgi:hypothetical protein
MYKKFLPLIQFLPLSLFSSYGFWQNHMSNERWLEAFQLAALAGIIQLIFTYFQQKPINRLILATNFYLICGGLAAFFQQWWYLEIVQSLQESAIFIFMILVGLITTLTNTSGYLAADNLAKNTHRYSSYILLFATFFALFNANAFQGEIVRSAIIPIILLSLLHRYLVFRLINGQNNCD